MALTLVELGKRIEKLEHQNAVLTQAFTQMTNRFALYWIDDLKPPAFAIVLREHGKDERLADLVIYSEHLSVVDMKFNKPLVSADADMPKRGHWEPMILPLKLISAQIRQKAVEEQKAKTVKDAVEELQSDAAPAAKDEPAEGTEGSIFLDDR